MILAIILQRTIVIVGRYAAFPCYPFYFIVSIIIVWVIIIAMNLKCYYMQVNPLYGCIAESDLILQLWAAFKFQ